MRIGEPKESYNDGKTVEYEPMVAMSCGAEVPQSRLAEYHAAQGKAQHTPKDKSTGKVCPLKRGNWCQTNCALFRHGTCMITLLCRGTIDETEGKRCPFEGMGVCSHKCGLHIQRGCSIQGLR